MIKTDLRIGYNTSSGFQLVGICLDSEQFTTKPEVIENYDFRAETRRMVQSKLLKTISTRIKLLRGCEAYKLGIPELCKPHTLFSYMLDFSHMPNTIKYQTKTGKTLQPSDLVYRGVSIKTFLEEVAKCWVMCKLCHAYYTHEVERGEA